MRYEQKIVELSDEIARLEQERAVYDARTPSAGVDVWTAGDVYDWRIHDLVRHRDALEASVGVLCAVDVEIAVAAEIHRVASRDADDYTGMSRWLTILALAVILPAFVVNLLWVPGVWLPVATGVVLAVGVGVYRVWRGRVLEAVAWAAHEDCVEAGERWRNMMVGVEEGNPAVNLDAAVGAERWDTIGKRVAEDVSPGTSRSVARGVVTLCLKGHNRGRVDVPSNHHGGVL